MALLSYRHRRQPSRDTICRKTSNWLIWHNYNFRFSKKIDKERKIVNFFEVPKPRFLTIGSQTACEFFLINPKKKNLLWILLNIYLWFLFTLVVRSFLSKFFENVFKIKTNICYIKFILYRLLVFALKNKNYMTYSERVGVCDYTLYSRRVHDTKNVKNLWHTLFYATDSDQLFCL